MSLYSSFNTFFIILWKVNSETENKKDITPIKPVLSIKLSKDLKVR